MEATITATNPFLKKCSLGVSFQINAWNAIAVRHLTVGMTFLIKIVKKTLPMQGKWFGAMSYTQGQNEPM